MRPQISASEPSLAAARSPRRATPPSSDMTVTSGIISALGRTGLGIEGYEDFIQAHKRPRHFT
jgi:hypothetical protein